MQSPDEQQRAEQAIQLWRPGSTLAQLQPAEVRATFLDFHQREYVPVVTFLRRANATLEDAEDAAQEAFLQAWRYCNRLGGWESIRSARGWIRRIAINEYYRILRERPKRSPFEEDLTEYIPRGQAPDHGELTVQAEFVRAILGQLDPETRAVMAFHTDGFRSVDIAKYLSMSDQKVRDLTKKGRKALMAGLASMREHNRRHVQ